MTMTDSVYVPKNPLGELIIKLGFLDLLVWARCKQKWTGLALHTRLNPRFDEAVIPLAQKTPLPSLFSLKDEHAAKDNYIRKQSLPY